MKSSQPWSLFTLLLALSVGTRGVSAETLGAEPAPLLAQGQPLSFARKLYKVHRVDPKLSLAVQEANSNAIQKEIDSQVGAIEQSVRQLDRLVDQKSEAEANLAQMRRRRRRLAGRSRRSGLLAVDLKVPKFDPILSSADPMSLYDQHMKAGFEGSHHMGASPILHDFIVRNAPILRRVSESGGSLNALPGSGGSVFGFFGGQASPKTRRRSSLSRSTKTRKNHLSSSDLLYQILDRPHPASNLPKYRPSGDIIARMNRKYTQHNIMRRRMPIHDLKEEYRKSNSALDQLFGPLAARKSHRQASHRLGHRRSHHRRTRHSLNKTTRIFKKSLKRTRKAAKKVNILQKMFHKRNKSRRNSIHKRSQSLLGGLMRAASFRNGRSQAASQPSLIFGSPVSRPAEHPQPYLELSVATNPLMNDLYSLGPASGKSNHVSFPRLGHSDFTRRSRPQPFVPTLSKLLADRRQQDQELRQQLTASRGQSTFVRHQAKAHTLRDELDSFLNELTQANGTVGSGII